MKTASITRFLSFVLAFAVFCSCSAYAYAEEKKDKQKIIEEMVVDYGSYGEEAEERVWDLLKELRKLDADAADRWESIMALWRRANTALTLHEGVLPDGLPDTDELCIVVLGFQLESDGSMAPELRGRCETALACAEKYPRALIAVTGGGTAWQSPGATESGVMAAWLTEHGISPERIIAEDASMTTADNAVFTCRILRERCPQVRSLAVVSSDYHVPLGVLLFQARAYLDEYETGTLPFTVVSNAAFNTGGRYQPDSPMMQKTWLWSVADPHY